LIQKSTLLWLPSVPGLMTRLPAWKSQAGRLRRVKGLPAAVLWLEVVLLRPSPP